MSRRLLVAIIAAAVCGVSHADLIDLNTFFADPDVAISPDGSTVTLFESPLYSPVLLSYDPFLDGPPIVIPGPGARLMFDYDFVEGPLSDDEFGAFIFDASNGVPIAGFELFTDAPGSGSVSYNLSSLSGLTLGLQFELSSLLNDADFESRVMVSNVRVAIVPEPTTLVLGLVSGTLALGRAVRRYRRRNA